MNVADPAGRVVCWFPHRQAQKRFALPSFWRSIKHITFTMDGGAILRFEPEKRDVSIVRDYLDDALLFGGIEVLLGYRRRALLSLAGGLGLVIICLTAVFFIDQVLQLKDQQGKRYARPFFVGAILGIALLGWGVYSLSRSLRLLRRWHEDNEGREGRNPQT